MLFTLEHSLDSLGPRKPLNPRPDLCCIIDRINGIDSETNGIDRLCAEAAFSTVDKKMRKKWRGTGQHAQKAWFWQLTTWPTVGSGRSVACAITHSKLVICCAPLLDEECRTKAVEVRCGRY
jgi:hypothetical protein